MLDDFKRKGDRLFTVSESLDTIIESIEKMNRKMETDLKEIENDFNDINKSDVVNCFDNVIKLVIKEQKLSNHAIMTHEGNELIEHGYYKVMNGQLSLF